MYPVDIYYLANLDKLLFDHDSGNLKPRAVKFNFILLLLVGENFWDTLLW